MSIQPGRRVVEYLKEVDYAFPGYVPSDHALEFANFIKFVNDGEGDENETPLVHLKMMDDVFTDEKWNSILCHRGIGKTSLFAEYLFLYIAAFGNFPGFGETSLILYVTDSIENGVKNLRRNVEHRYRNPDFLRRLIPDISMKSSEDEGNTWEARYDEDGNYIPKPGAKFTDVRLEFVNLAGHKLVVKGYGAKTGVRGAKEMGIRPQVAILDDLVSDEDARSDTIIETIENTVHKAVSKALHPKRQKTVWLGTPFNEKDPLYKAVESGAWHATVYPIAEEFDATTTRDTFSGSWEDRFDYEYCKDEYDKAQLQGRPEDFDQELMLRIMSKDQQLIQDTDIQWYDDSSIMKYRDNYNFYITTDLATSNSKKSDNSVISVWAVNNNGDYLWVDGVVKQQLLNNSLDDLFRLVQTYRPIETGIEVDGQQGGHVAYIKERMMTTNTFFRLASMHNNGNEGIRSAGSRGGKHARFIVMQPLFAQRRFWFPERLRDDARIKEFMNEILNVSFTDFNSKRDDCIDTITQLQFLNIYKPANDLEYKKNISSGIYEEVDFDEDENQNPYCF